MVSPGTHLVNSHKFLSITSESQIENACYGHFNQTVNLERNAKTLYYSALKPKYSPIFLKHKMTKIYRGFETIPKSASV